ncbi:N-acetylmuramoyl-L-alanine amidase [Enterococcus timonensis]|uniref:N-acetylmuramoyl-L-alanine amidase n=1 Tax=Enterococcus timonensis TaxID=1852364 RepID=UPI0008DA4CDF|nr:N-acetylmuramoyl-L-alanine amidase [Enterococcus timonensis]
MLPIQKRISAYNFNNSNSVKYIVVHDVGAQSTAKNNVDYFFGGNRNASAHYFVDDSSIWQSVEESHGAWHCGDGHGKYGITNSNSIGIEMCLPSGAVTEKTEANTLELVKHLQSKYGVDNAHVVRHYDASRKNCPAQFNLDGKWTRWNAFKAKLAGTPSKPAADVPAPSKPAAGGGYVVKAWNKKQVVDIDVLNVRTTATSQSTLVRQLKKGQTFTATRIITNGEQVGQYKSWFEADGWGWVSGAYVTEIKASTPKLKGSDLPNSGRYTFTANTNIRSNASTGSSVVGLYSKGQSVIYDSKVTAGGYVWLSYIGASGNRRYVAVV